MPISQLHMETQPNPMIHKMPLPNHRIGRSFPVHNKIKKLTWYQHRLCFLVINPNIESRNLVAPEKNNISSTQQNFEMQPRKEKKAYKLK